MMSTCKWRSYFYPVWPSDLNNLRFNLITRFISLAFCLKQSARKWRMEGTWLLKKCSLLPASFNQLQQSDEWCWISRLHWRVPLIEKTCHFFCDTRRADLALSTAFLSSTISIIKVLITCNSRLHPLMWLMLLSEISARTRKVLSYVRLKEQCPENTRDHALRTSRRALLSPGKCASSFCEGQRPAPTFPVCSCGD